MLSAARLKQRARSEEGFALVFVALALVVLMIFAAMVVDIGAVYSKRRDDQNAADVAALAAVHELSVGDQTAKENAIFATVKQQAHQALGTVLTNAQWDSCPAGGTGAGQDPGVLLNQISFASCISYNPVRVRVRLPDQYWDTTFGAVIGQGQIRHSAFAIAGLEPEGFGGVLPFAVTGVSASGGLGCLKTNSNGQASALCGSTTGNFGFLDFSQFGPVLGDPSLNTTQSCGSGDTGPRIEANTAMGVDHELSIQGSVHVNPVADAPDACQAGIENPDAAFTQTGNMEDRISRGLFFKSDTPANPVYSDGKPARLQREDAKIFGTGGSRVDDVAGVDNLDDNALWRFIPPGVGPVAGDDIPTSCQRNQFVDNSDAYYPNITDNPNLDGEVAAFLENLSTRDQMLALINRCFQHYLGLKWDGTPVGSLEYTGSTGGEPPSGCDVDGTAACTDPVFALDTDPSEDPNVYDIQYTSRFGYVPEITDFPPGGSQKRGFVRFRAVFIQRLVIEEGGSSYDFDPGFGPDYSGYSTDSDTYADITGYQRIGEALVYVFPKGMLPNRLADDEAPFLLGVNRFPELIR